MTFDDFKDKLFALHEQGAFQDGLDLIGAHSAEFPQQRQRLAYYQACLANCAGDSELALNTLSDALDAGYWFSPGMLQGDGDLNSLHESARFAQIVAASEARMMEALADSTPSRVVFEPAEMSASVASAEPLPLLFVLHGNESSVKREADHWAQLAEDGWLVVLPQSSQLSGPDRFVWDDVELAQQELLEQFGEISAEYKIDPARVVLGGFSRGALRALELALSNGIEAAGFIGIATSIAEADALMERAEVAATKQALYFAVGSKDSPILQATETLAQRLQQAGLRCKVHEFEGGHAYPNDIETVLQSATAFIQ